MTLNNIQELLILNNREILTRMKKLKSDIDSSVSGSSAEAGRLIEEIKTDILSFKERERLSTEEAQLKIKENKEKLNELNKLLENKHKESIDKIKENLDLINKITENLNKIETRIKDHIENQLIHVTQAEKDKWNSFISDEKLLEKFNLYALKSDLHSHTNKEILDKISVNENGNLLFDGQEIKGGGGGEGFGQEAKQYIKDVLSNYLKTADANKTFTTITRLESELSKYQLKAALNNNISISAIDDNAIKNVTDGLFAKDYSREIKLAIDNSAKAKEAADSALELAKSMEKKNDLVLKGIGELIDKINRTVVP